MKQCNCAETWLELEGKAPMKLPPTKFHDCEYIYQRNRRIPAASKYAEEVLENSGAVEPDHRSRVFNAAFGKRMNELCKSIL